MRTCLCKLQWTLILLAGTSLRGWAQSDYIGLGDQQYGLLNRLDIRLQNDSVLSFSAFRPYNRRSMTRRVQWIDSLDRAGGLPFRLTNADRYDVRNLLMSNGKWPVTGETPPRAGKPLVGHLFRTPAHLYETYSKDFVLVVDPILYVQGGRSSDVEQNLFVNTRGVRLRGRIDKVGFYSSLTENQERDPLYVQHYVARQYGLPGVGYYKTFKGDAYDYFDAKGGIDFAAGKHFNFRFAYDKLLIGDGYRSLLLSDFGNSYLHFQMDVQIRKFSYRAVYAELTAPFDPVSNRDTVRYKNYMALHRLDIQLTRWLNVGLYENVLYNGRGGIELSYLNPVIFYRAVEMQLGSGSSKATVGLDLKANVSRSLQCYGQLVVGEWVLKELLHYGRHSWLNKEAIQLGVKYIDAAGVKNLDLQAEVNTVRPYMYQHRDSANAYAHYNLPLAHPAGANFKEVIFLAGYRPVARLYLSGKLFGRKQGLDSAGYNMGSDIFRSYNSRPRDYGLFTGAGIPAVTWLCSLSASYELMQQLFLDAGMNWRHTRMEDQPAASLTFYSAGLRWNIGRRLFEF